MGAAGHTDIVDGDVAEEALVGEPAEDDHLGLADPYRRVPATGISVYFLAGFRGEGRDRRRRGQVYEGAYGLQSIRTAARMGRR